MSHHRQISLSGGEVLGHVVMTNLGQVLSITIQQPWGENEVFRSQYPEIKEEKE